MLLDSLNPTQRDAVEHTEGPLLILAGALVGLVVGFQRRVTGGILGPTITHLTWSLGMLFLLPPVLDRLS